MSYNNISLNNSWVSFLNAFVIFDMFVSILRIYVKDQSIYPPFWLWYFPCCSVYYKDLNPNISDLAITIAAN